MVEQLIKQSKCTKYVELLAHVLPINRCSFGPHVINGFFAGVTMEHYHCFNIFIPSTGGVCISDTVRWFPHGSLKLPIQSNDEHLCSTINDLRTTLQSSLKKILTPEGVTSGKTLLELNDIFNNRDLRYPPTKPPTHTDVPTMIFQSKDPTIVPRVKLHSNDTTRFTMVQPPAAIPSPKPTLWRSKCICNPPNPIVAHNSNATIHLSTL